MPATPRWRLAILDAIRQLAARDRALRTRRDRERRCGVSQGRAGALMTAVSRATAPAGPGPGGPCRRRTEKAAA